MKTKRDSLGLSKGSALKNGSMILDKCQGIWSRKEQDLPGVKGRTAHVVIWKFVDDNCFERTVILRHDQDANDGNAKTLRSLQVDGQEVFPEQKSKQNVFEHQLVVDEHDADVKVRIELRYEESIW